MYGKGITLALLVIGFVLVANVRCAPENVDPEDLSIRVRRQLPSIPSIPGLPNPGSALQNAAKNIPGADQLPIPRSSRSVPATATGAPDSDSMMDRVRREARGTGNLPTKSG